jgi:hypothetical protein
MVEVSSMLCCRAINLTEQLAPGTLEASPSVLLRLHIQIFIELVSHNLLLRGHAQGPMHKVHIPGGRPSPLVTDFLTAKACCLALA